MKTSTLTVQVCVLIVALCTGRAEKGRNSYAPYIEAGHSRHYDSPMEEGAVLSRDDCPVPDSPEQYKYKYRSYTKLQPFGADNTGDSDRLEAHQGGVR